MTQIKTLTKLFINKQIDYKGFKESLVQLDVDAANLLQSYRTKKFTAKGFIKAYQDVVTDRICQGL